jgi:hypothetical protein
MFGTEVRTVAGRKLVVVPYRHAHAHSTETGGFPIEHAMPFRPFLCLISSMPAGQRNELSHGREGMDEE